MGQLGGVGDHGVVVLGGADSDSTEAQGGDQFLRPGDGGVCFGGVHPFRRDQDHGSVPEEGGAAGREAREVAPRHGVTANKLHPVRQYTGRLHNGALNAAHVGDQRPGLKMLLMFPKKSLTLSNLLDLKESSFILIIRKLM